jgi:small-conductance mechanosensitive channel
MSFREKTAWITLIAIIAVSLMYWFHMPNPFVAQPPPRVLHAMGASLIAYLVIEAVGWLVLRWRYPRDAREPRDERERLIDLRALRVAYYAFLALSMAGIFVTLHLAGAGSVAVGMAVFTAFVLSQIAKYGARIIFYRRGF